MVTSGDSQVAAFCTIIVNSDDGDVRDIEEKTSQIVQTQLLNSDQCYAYTLSNARSKWYAR